jgi:hypothetical protein
MSTSVPEPHAVYPLTAFDTSIATTIFLTEWLVEGTIDGVELASALKRLTQKWRMLAARLESVKEPGKVSFVHLKYGSSSIISLETVLAASDSTWTFASGVPDVLSDHSNLRVGPFTLHLSPAIYSLASPSAFALYPSFHASF